MSIRTLRAPPPQDLRSDSHTERCLAVQCFGTSFAYWTLGRRMLYHFPLATALVQQSVSPLCPFLSFPPPSTTSGRSQYGFRASKSVKWQKMVEA
jgi:hypothetical protein